MYIIGALYSVQNYIFCSTKLGFGIVSGHFFCLIYTHNRDRKIIMNRQTIPTVTGEPFADFLANVTALELAPAKYRGKDTTMWSQKYQLCNGCYAQMDDPQHKEGACPLHTKGHLHCNKCQTTSIGGMCVCRIVKAILFNLMDHGHVTLSKGRKLGLNFPGQVIAIEQCGHKRFLSILCFLRHVFGWVHGYDRDFSWACGVNHIQYPYREEYKYVGPPNYAKDPPPFKRYLIVWTGNIFQEDRDHNVKKYMCTKWPIFTRSTLDFYNTRYLRARMCLLCLIRKLPLELAVIICKLLYHNV